MRNNGWTTLNMLLLESTSHGQFLAIFLSRDRRSIERLPSHAGQRLRVPLDMRTGGRGCKLFKRNMRNKGGLVVRPIELRGIIGLGLQGCVINRARQSALDTRRGAFPSSPDHGSGGYTDKYT